MLSFHWNKGYWQKNKIKKKLTKIKTEHDEKLMFERLVPYKYYLKLWVENTRI